VNYLYNHSKTIKSQLRYVKLDASSLWKKERKEKEKKKKKHIIRNNIKRRQSFIPFLMMHLRLYDLMLCFNVYPLFTATVTQWRT